MQVESATTAAPLDAIRQRVAQRNGDPHTTALRNAIVKNGIQNVALSQRSAIEIQPTFSHEIETGPITNQQRSGRCWIFAGLNTLRVIMARKHNLKDVELSQTYAMFWDKLEKANYFLESIIETVDEPLDGRLVAWLLDSPLQDGGQWDMFVNLLEKYGAVPKHVMPETAQSTQTMAMNRLLTIKLRQGAATLRERHAAGATDAELRTIKEELLADVYRLLCLFLGEPPTTFDYEYRDKDKQFHRDPGLTPREFYEKYVGVDLDEYVSVINAPTADKPFGRTYTVQYLGNVRGGRDVLYLNVDVGTLKSYVLRQVTSDEPVWFGCDVGKMMDRDSGLLDADLYDYEGVLGTSFDLTKAQRLDLGESRMTHAMVITGVNVTDEGPNRWKIENSWGKESGHEGFLLMADDWFDEYVYQAVVHKSYLSDELRRGLEQPPVVLPPWDPMGALA